MLYAIRRVQSKGWGPNETGESGFSEVISFNVLIQNDTNVSESFTFLSVSMADLFISH